MLLGYYDGDWEGAGYDVEIVGSIAYLADYRYGLRILDVINPSAPVCLGAYDGDIALDVTVVGSTAYVADTMEGAKAIDVSGPASPTLETATGLWTYGVEASGNNVYAVGYGFYVLALQTPVIDLTDASDTGTSNADNVTDDTTPMFEVTGSAEYVRIYRDGVLASGEYETGPVTLGEQPFGEFEYTVRAVDAAGNLSEPSEPLAVTIYCHMGDCTFDGKVDGADLALWQQNYNPLGV